MEIYRVVALRVGNGLEQANFNYKRACADADAMEPHIPDPGVIMPLQRAYAYMDVYERVWPDRARSASGASA